MDRNDPSCRPSLEDMQDFVNLPAFIRFCETMQETCQAKAQIDFSKCSMEPGWNLKFKRSGRSLCTVYPALGSFTVLAVIGPAERDWAEAMLPGCCETLQEIYKNTAEGNGQHWLMIPIGGEDALYEDMLKLIELRAKSRKVHKK